MQNKGMTIVGWILTVVLAAGLTMSAVMKFLAPPEMVDEFVTRLGYPQQTLDIIGATELTCVVLFLLPETAVLGAVLLTGYLGGAIATHVRISDNFLGPAIGGVLVWLALYFRDPRIRALLPFRKKLELAATQPPVKN